jgi:hypothetical protein
MDDVVLYRLALIDESKMSVIRLCRYCMVSMSLKVSFLLRLAANRALPASRASATQATLHNIMHHGRLL